ncbi:Gfo/Idh/MocA family oxidoreductase [Candidatus Desulfarcum epimagneticum]|uniref:Gfo/Idh/MocA family oxidoreductase n=1 Tax=uncultured Desulfobacteraceae bacterium TaxID=218296 RepID=A0A484HFC5_9BACT|nr:Gfo/Idh/MocA family oxidoreductase [uncultured Desulfobacteraceae bacterium]
MSDKKDTEELFMSSRASKPLRLGFIGGGLNSAIGSTHRIAVEMDGRFALKAGCFSAHQDINHETGQAWGVDESRVYDDWRALLRGEKKRLDAVVVLTPTPSHMDIVLGAMRKGFPVICEKTLATSSAEAEEIKKAVQKYNAFLAVTYNYSGYPMLREMKMMIEKGMLGKITQIHAEMPQDGFIRVDAKGRNVSPQAWRLKDTQTLATVSLDLGTHTHHMIHFLTGSSPLEVLALQDSFGAFKQIIDNVVCVARYANHMVCQLWHSKCALGHRNGLRVRVYGTKGSARWRQMDPEHLSYTDITGQTRILDRATDMDNLSADPRYNRFKAGHPDGFIEAFANLYYDIADCLIEFKEKGAYASPWVFGADIAYEGLCMLEAICRSSQNKAWEKAGAPEKRG